MIVIVVIGAITACCLAAAAVGDTDLARRKQGRALTSCLGVLSSTYAVRRAPTMALEQPLVRINRDHHRINHRFEETAHRLRAKQASLQPLTSTAMPGTQADAQSADTATGVNRATPTTTSEIMAADPIFCPH